MYESPIQTYIDKITSSIREDYATAYEQKIVTEISSRIGVSVDKDELLRALAYDRNQYEKGFADGKLSMCMYDSEEKVKEFYEKLLEKLSIYDGVRSEVRWYGDVILKDMFPHYEEE